MSATALERDLARPMLPEYLERALQQHPGKIYRPEELARAVTREIRSDTGTEAHVSSRSVGTYLQHNASDLDFLNRIPDPDTGDRYLYSYSSPSDDDD